MPKRSPSASGILGERIPITALCDEHGLQISVLYWLQTPTSNLERTCAT